MKARPAGTVGRLKLQSEQAVKRMAQSAKEFSTKGNTQTTNVESRKINFTRNVFIRGFIIVALPWRDQQRPRVLNSSDNQAMHLSGF